MLIFKSYIEEQLNKTNKKFSELEAFLNLIIDFINNNYVSYDNYAIKWKWEKQKVKEFIAYVGLIISKKNKLKECSEINNLFPTGQEYNFSDEIKDAFFLIENISNFAEIIYS